MKTPEILEHLKSRIIDGEFKPGEKLPNRPELLREYSVSVSAFQKCINQLADWNFLESKGMKGVCVTPNPPHLCRFAMLLPVRTDKLPEESDTLFATFAQVISDWSASRPGDSFHYYHVGSATVPEMGEWNRFCSDANRGLLAGAISLMAVPPAELQLRLGEFPYVVISQKREDMPHNAPDIEFDMAGLFRMQLELLISQGCRNIAALLNDNMSIAKNLAIINIAEQAPVNCPRRWIQGMNLVHTRPLFYDHLLELFFCRDQAQVPDGLIVQNENFLPLILSAFTHLGIVPGEQVKIVSHGNLPVMHPRTAGVDYTGFRIDAVLAEAIGLLRCWKAGELKNRNINILIPPANPTAY